MEHEDEYQWLQEQLTKEVSEFSEENHYEEMDDYEDSPESQFEYEKRKFEREMRELQQALAYEVCVQTSKHNGKLQQKDKTEKSKEVQEEINENEGANDFIVPLLIGIMITILLVLIAIAIVICGKSIGKTALDTNGFLMIFIT